MKKLLSFAKTKKQPSGNSETGSVLSVGYDLKDKDLGKVHKAAAAGDLEKLRQLAKKKDINQLDKDNRTALHIACASGHVEVVLFLLEGKAKLNLCDNQNRSALMKAVQCQHERCVRLLLENHADPNLVDIKGNTALHLAANIPSVSTAVLLLEHEADINAPNKEASTPLAVAVREDHLEMAEFLLKEGADVSSPDHDKRSPLMAAAGNGQIAMLRLLLRFDADTSLKDNKGWSADDYAVMNGHHPCSLLIFEHNTQKTKDQPSSHQDPSQNKKNALSGNSSQHAGAGFHFSGPAIDRQDFEDNDSESLSRYSKSVPDEWASSEDDESLFGNKKPQKINLREMMALKRGEDEGAEEEPSCSKARSDSPEGSSETEDSEEEEGEEEEEEEEEDEEEGEEEEEEEEEGDDDDSSDEDEEDGDEEEEEEEEDDEEVECGNEEDVISVASVEGEEKPTAAGAGTDPQTGPGSAPSHTSQTSPGVGRENTPERETPENPTGCPAGSHVMPGKLDVMDDCVVSAVRVESKFSDEEDSLGKENLWSLARIKDPGSTGIRSSVEVKEEEFEGEMKNDGDPRANKQNTGETAWNQTVLCGRADVPEDVVGYKDGSSDAESEKEALKDKRRSSWGSSLEDSDRDLPDEGGVNKETVDRNNDLQPEAEALHSKTILPGPDEGLPPTSLDSPSAAMDEPLLSHLGSRSAVTPQSKHRSAPADGSCWDSSENREQADLCSLIKGEGMPSVPQTNQPGSCEEDEGSSIEKGPTDPSPAVSPLPEDENVSANQSPGDDSSMEGRDGSDREKDDDSSWDDEDESDDSEKQTTAAEGNVEKTPQATAKSPSPKWSSISRKPEEEAEKVLQSDVGGGSESPENRRRVEGNPLAVKQDDHSRDDDANEDSHSKDQKMENDFASAAVQVSSAGENSDRALRQPEAQLTAFVSFENRNDSQTRSSLVQLGEEPMKETFLSSPPTKRDQGPDSDGSSSDEALPQTDIDDVDLDSPEEAESLANIKWVTQEGSGDEDDDSEEDEDLSDESDGSEGSGAEEEKRVFRSGLGLEKEGRALNSSQSESSSESPEKMQEEKTRLDFQDQEKASVKEVNKENSLFIPTFSRGNRMGALEARWSVDRMRANLGEAGNSADDETGGKPVDKDELTQKEPPEKVRKGPLTLLSRLEGDKDQQMDVMEELGLGHIGDLDDLSDWDSTASNRSLPGGDPAFPGQDAAECSGSAKKPEEDKVPAPPLTPQRSIGSTRGSETSSPPQPVPHPRARKRSPQTAESGDESDLEPDRLASPSNTARIKAVTEGSTDPSPADEESEQQQLKRSDETVDTQEIDEGNPDPSAPAGSGGGEPDNDRRDQCGPEGGGGVADGIPWERRYEKLWVEVEKREVKSNYRNVAGELKERFGELPESRCPSEDSTQERQDESTSEEEDSSDEEEEGEVIVRPTTRARSTFLLTIPEQRESGLEDSLSESSDKSSSEDKFQDHGGPAYKTSACPEPDGAKPGPLRKPHLDLNWKETAAAPDEAVTGHTSSDEDLEERSCPPSLRRRAASVPGVSDEELEEDMERFKVEVGVLRGVFLDLEKEKAQLQKEVGRHDPKSAVEGQRSSNSWDTGGAAPQEVGAEESNARLKVLLSPDGGIQQEHPPAATESADRPPLHPPPPLQQACDHHKQEGQAEQETLQPEPVRGARHSRALQTISHLNGDPLLVSDDSSVSDVSDVGGRPSTGGLRKHKNPEEIEMAENLDELSLSSDTLSDDAPASGYHHASQLIQKLGLSSLDSKSTLKLQSIFHEYERSIEKARSRHGYLKYKVSQLEMEKAELTSSLEEANDVTFGLERDRLELQSDIANLKFRLKQDQENCRNTTMLFDITKDRLRKTEEQQQLEVQEKQKVELTLRNLEMEMRTLVTNMKQLEDEHIETQRLLAQERSVRTLQENVLNNHLRKQQEIEEENQKSSHEVMSQLTAASGREREFLQQTAVLQEQLSILKSDLDCSRANSSLTHGQLSEENGILKGQLDAARRELSLGSDALTKTIFDCNNKVTAIRSELAMTGASLENERKTHEILQAEVESTRIRLAEAVKETELCQRAQRDTERSLLREKEEHQRLKDRLSGEAASQREVISSLSQKLAKAEANANNMENDVHRVTLQLTEKDLLLDVLQREKDQSATRVKDLETTLQAEKELVIRAGARQEAAQERLAQAQSEGLLLRQQLEETQNKDVAKAHAVTDAQERFSDMLSKLRSDCSERVHLVEDKNKELVSKVADLRDQNYKLEDERNQREGGLRQLQQELADSLKKLSMSEAHLEVNARYRSDLEEEKARLLKDLDRLKGKLQESEDQYVGAEKRIISLKNTLDDREKELATAVQKVQAAEVAAAATDATIKHLEETMHRLEIENARQEVAAKQQTSRLDSLQKGAEEASMLRGHLEELVTNLQSSKMTLENQLSHEVQKQSALTHTVQDSHNMWEEELKSHSKLGLRLAELEKEKGEASAQMEVEKKKVRKVVEQKNSLETRLDQEMTRNTELQKEMYRLRSLLKTAKRKLRDQDRGGAEHDSPLRRRDLDGHSGPEGAFGRLTERVDDLRTQLEKEASLRGRLERANEDLKDQLGSMRSFNNSNDELHRSKRLLEQEVLDLRRRMETSQVEQNQMEHYLQQRTRQEVQQKLDQVNLFLQSEAASRETMDRIKTTGAANLRVQLEQKILKLEGELGHAHSARLELERYKQLYTDELRLRQALATKLDRLNAQLAEANTKLLKSSGRSLIPGGLLLDPGSSGSPTHYRATAGNLSGSQGLGVSFLSSVTDRQRGGVEDYLSKVQSELDRSISKELKNAAAELDMTSTRLSPVGSASWVELDPVHRASQQYLEVLKKNYEI